MTTVYDVPADHLIRSVAEELKKRQEIKPPAWAAFAKTGVHKEMPPEDPDWWFTRAAAVLRRVYVDWPPGCRTDAEFLWREQEPRLETECFPEGQRLDS